MKKSLEPTVFVAPNENRIANLLGAAALGLSDRIRNSSRQILARDGATAAALSLIGHNPAISVLSLSRILEMSHPGTVRLLDTLAAAGMVNRRRSTKDGRTAELHLSEDGYHARQEMLRERQKALLAAISGLSSTETEQLEQILEKIIRKLPRNEVHCHTICRFCDEDACTDCPMEARTCA